MSPPVVPAWREAPLPRHWSFWTPRRERSRLPGPELRNRPRRRSMSDPPPHAGSGAFVFDRLELGFRGVAFLHHPVEGFEEVVDARIGSLRDAIPHDLVDLARTLASQQQLGV